MSKTIKSNFQFVSNQRNLNYEDGLRELEISDSLRSCLLRNNSDRNGENEGRKNIVIKTKPKWFTVLKFDETNVETGEIMEDMCVTDEFNRALNRKLKKTKEFFDFYENLYKNKEVSLLFFTLTQANLANVTIAMFIDALKQRTKRMGNPIRGYFWVSEISKSNHFHYHLCVAINRIEIKKMPDELKMNGIWGKRTQVEFVKGMSIKSYVNKKLGVTQCKNLSIKNYMSKTNNAYPEKFRNYGKSRFFY